MPSCVYPLLRPLLFALPPERAHRLTIAALKASPLRPPAPDPRLATRVAGLDFPSPIGLAAGFDKDAEVPDALLGLGFGFVEIGTVTPLPQPGNPRPRMFRLATDRAVINRLGFNSGGQRRALERLTRRAGRPGVVGVNLGANKDAADRIADYDAGARVMAPHADYLTINISSPNTPGLRGLQDAAQLDALLARVMAARGSAGPPVFLKVAPDLDPPAIDAIVRVTIEHGAAGLIVGNTTVTRPPLRSRAAGEASGGRLPLIAAGGIASAADAYARIRAGASLVQLYTALIYEGPGLPRRIAAGLGVLLARDGFASVAEAVG